MKKTIGLACILKNEVRNLPRLLESVEGCFDEVHLTDTGSTDGSVELITSWIESGTNPSGSKLFLHHFQWVDDFSAARNASFAPLKTDYIMWMDLDDVLSSKDDFKKWRDHSLYLADFWLNTYHYSLSKEGKPLCSFARERIIKNGLGLKWKYFVHEGILPDKKNLSVSYAQTWTVNHLRDEEDLKADRSRNIRIFEKHPERDARMSYYYGKELFENGKPLEAFTELSKSITDPELALHDRIMGIQYACLAAMQLNQMEKAISLAHQGLQLSPHRAEFFVVIADCYVKQNKVMEATCYYAAAANCHYQGNSGMQGAIFAHEDSYRAYPMTQLAKLKANTEKFDESEEWLKKALHYSKAPELEKMLQEIGQLKEAVKPAGEGRQKVSDIIITCPPNGFYEWDWGIYQEKGIGGSETAAVEMAHKLADLTGRKVKVFAPRETVAHYGLVEYHPARAALSYIKQYEPALHIAWRHATRFDTSPYYVWSHDLSFPGVESLPENAKVLALSPFHKGFLMGLYGVKEEKIIVTSNGIEPKRFGEAVAKEFGKIVYSSSPDRGLERAIRVMDEVVKVIPEARLHVYYGFGNMEKLGLTDKVQEFKSLIEKRPYIVFHGNVSQKKLTEELKTAQVWLYPTNFLETYCITAVEMLCSGVFPVVRAWGALKDTLRLASLKGMAKVLDSDCETAEEVKLYANAVIDAVQNDAWKRVKVDPNDHSWEKVAREWVSLFNLGDRPCLKLSNS